MKLPIPRAIAAICFSVLPVLACAQLTGNIALTSNYKFRGQDQDMLASNRLAKEGAVKPAVQGGFNYAFADSGFYLGNWNSSVNWLPGNSIEMDIYGGYKFTAGPVDLDFGALTYQYPGNTAGNTTELYGAATHASDALGTLVFKYSHTVSRDYFNFAGAKGGSGRDGRNTGYFNIAWTRPILPNLSLKAALGYTRMNDDIRSLGYRSYADFSVGTAYDFGGGLSLLASVQGANRNAAFAALSDAASGRTYSPNKPRLVLTLSKTL